jgi:signal transduction histidine kinase
MQLHMLSRPDVSDERKQRAIQTMQRSVSRATQMLDDFLDLARVQAGRLILHPTSLDVCRFLRETVETFEEQAKQNGITLKLQLPERVMATGDEHRIAQVLNNLVSNAIRYSPNGGNVTVAARDSDAYAEFQVIDDGRGMTAEQLGRLFQPFAQVQGTAEEAQGTGLGLYLSKAIVNAHGGVLTLTSPGPGRGTKAFFTLPKQPPKVGPQPPSPEEGDPENEDLLIGGHDRFVPTGSKDRR